MVWQKRIIVIWMTERVFGIGKYRAFTEDHMRPLKGRALSCLGALGGS